MPPKAKQPVATAASTAASVVTKTTKTTMHFSNFVVTPDLNTEDLSKADVVGGYSGPTTLTFDVTDVPLCIVNALRRTVTSDVPMVGFCVQQTDESAIGSTSTIATFQRNKSSHAASLIGMQDQASSMNSSSVGALSMNFLANTTTLHNEFLGDRIALIPISMDENQLHAFESFRFKFVLRAKNTTKDIVPVTSADISVYDNTGNKYPQALRDSLFPPSDRSGDHILIAKLRPGPAGGGGGGTGGMDGDELHVEMKAMLGLGRDHARFISVCDCFFRNKMDVDAAEKDLQEKLKLIPEGAPDREALVNRFIVQHGALNAQRCFIQDAFEFKITSKTRLRPAYLVFRAMQVIIFRLEDIVRSIQSMAAADAAAEDSTEMNSHDKMVKISHVPHMDDLYHVFLHDDDHTIGNLVQKMFYDYWIAEEDSDRVSYVGYSMPHPQERVILIKIRLTKPGPNIRDLLVEGLQRSIAILTSLMKEWIDASGLKAMNIGAVKDALVRI